MLDKYDSANTKTKRSTVIKLQAFDLYGALVYDTGHWQEVILVP